jgi:hypothetical protein
MNAIAKNTEKNAEMVTVPREYLMRLLDACIQVNRTCPEVPGDLFAAVMGEQWMTSCGQPPEFARALLDDYEAWVGEHAEEFEEQGR